MSKVSKQVVLFALSLLVTACAGDGGMGFDNPGGGGSGGGDTAAGPDAGVSDPGDPGDATDPNDPGGADAPGGGNVQSDAEWPTDPCATPNNPPPGYNLFKGTNGDDVINFSNKPGNQMIVAGPGNDTIYAGPGNDIICAGPGRDLVYGQAGDDYIDGGYANDELHGNNGNDIIHGRAGSDTIYGEGGSDLLFGDILDDELFGGDGNDILIGGHGTDFMHGGEGNDWLRGDTNGDQFVGGAGTDVASFMTATPPGQAGFGPNPPAGVDARLNLDSGQHCSGKSPYNLTQKMDYPGCSWGDGRDGMMGIEAIVGSPFDDRIAAGPGVNHLYGGYGNDEFTNLGGADVVVGGPGQDTCNGTACDDAGEGTVAYPLVYVDSRPRDLGLVFLGGNGDDAVHIARNGDGVTVRSTNGGALHTGAFCRYQTPGDQTVVFCDIPHTLRYVLAWGGPGNDTITIGDNFPRDFTAYTDGGPGDDVLNGGAGEDVMFAGHSGHDQLFGNAGSDALISESTDGDLLNAGPGNDQIVSNYPCAGHTYAGGPGEDIAGFARVGTKYRVKAQLGGPAQNATNFHGRAFSPGTCGDNPATWTVLQPGLEILEGGSLNDVLYGDDGPNIIWARDGDDEVRGYGGNDIILGGKGNDTIYGGPGRDSLSGNNGYDHLYAADGEADRQLSCGGGGGRVNTRDPNDPAGSNCN